MPTAGQAGLRLRQGSLEFSPGESCQHLALRAGGGLLTMRVPPNVCRCVQCLHHHVATASFPPGTLAPPPETVSPPHKGRRPRGGRDLTWMQTWRGQECNRQLRRIGVGRRLQSPCFRQAQAGQRCCGGRGGFFNRALMSGLAILGLQSSRLSSSVVPPNPCRRTWGGTVHLLRRLAPGYPLQPGPHPGSAVICHPQSLVAGTGEPT